jgi:hypothetical protein
MLPNVRPPVTGMPIIPMPVVGEPFRPITTGNCPAGGDHQFQLWSAKYRCIKCGYTQ